MPKGWDRDGIGITGRKKKRITGKKTSPGEKKKKGHITSNKPSIYKTEKGKKNSPHTAYILHRLLTHPTHNSEFVALRLLGSRSRVKATLCDEVGVVDAIYRLRCPPCGGN